MAKLWLDQNLEGNRNIRPTYVDYLAREIKEGRWKVTHQGIAFDIKNNLIDGQHRLSAIILADKPVSLLVTYDVPIGEFNIIDRGIPRSIGDTLHIPSAIIAIYNAMLFLKDGYSMRTSISDVNKLAKSDIGLVANELLSYCNSAAKIFSSAAFKVAAVVSIIDSGRQDYVFKTYRDLVLSNYEELLPIAKDAMKQVATGRWRMKARRENTSIYILGLSLIHI